MVSFTRVRLVDVDAAVGIHRFYTQGGSPIIGGPPIRELECGPARVDGTAPAYPR
jgi:hypothetical protein